MAENIKRNPLSVILGAYLKRERNNLRQTSSHIADKLSLGDSIYRMIEAGSANLNINRLSLVISTFEESRIRLERLAKYMAAIQIFDFEISKNTSSNLALSIIGEKDADLEYFIEKTAELYNYEYGSDKYKITLDEVAIKELSSLLGDSNYGKKEVADFKTEAIETFLDVPSIELPNILKFLSSLSNRQPLHVGPVAQEWEINTKGFQTLRGIYKRSDIIISEPNLEGFLYDYLFSEKFVSLQMIFIEEKLSPGELKEKFIKELNSFRVRHNKKILGERQKNKIHFKTVSNSNKNLIEEIMPLLKGREDIFPSLDAYWNFKHDTGIEISFVGGAAAAKNYAINLSCRESFKRTELFDKIWNNL